MSFIINTLQTLLFPAVLSCRSYCLLLHFSHHYILFLLLNFMLHMCTWQSQYDTGLGLWLPLCYTIAIPLAPLITMASPGPRNTSLRWIPLSSTPAPEGISDIIQISSTRTQKWFRRLYLGNNTDNMPVQPMKLMWKRDSAYQQRERSWCHIKEC